MKILVTGGAGFIGSHLIDALSKNADDDIIILDNFYRRKIDNIKIHLKNIKIINGDVRNYNLLKKIRKVDFVYHLAAQSNVVGSFFNPDYAVSSNIEGTYNILKYASKNNVKRLIFSSSREVYGNPKYLPVDESHPLNPINIYGATKVAGEMLCKAFFKNQNLKITVLRITNVYGPRDKYRVIPIFLENARNNKDLELFGGKQTLDFIWICDVIKSIIKISRNNKYIGETINIGTGMGTSIENLAKIIVKMTNSESRIIRKESRSIDVQNFISKSDKFKFKTLNLNEGLNTMISQIETR